jgi:hypothetical protein
MRRTAIEKLLSIIESNGASYDDIAEYQENQRSESWSNCSLCMKYFLLQQRQNFNKSCESYLLLERPYFKKS